MSNELSKTISTCVVWIAVTCILTFGIFKMNVTGDGLVFLVSFCLPLCMLYAAVKTTTIIWKSPREDQKPANPAASLTIKS